MHFGCESRLKSTLRELYATFKKPNFGQVLRQHAMYPSQEWNGKNVKKRIQDERSAYYIHYCLKVWGS